MPTPPSDRLLAEAAELRAAGSSWETVSAVLGRAVSTVRQWPSAYRDRWTAALRAAEARLATEAAAESVLALRAQLRSKDIEISRTAARQLIQYRVALDKIETPDPVGPAPSGSDAARVAAHLEALTDDQRDQLVDRALSILIAERDGRGAEGSTAGA
jgi:hypothetical protein